MPVLLDQFVQQIVASGLMTAEEIAAFSEGMSADKRPADSEQLARELVRHKKLTAHQAKEIYSGRGKSLVLGNYVILDKLGQGGMGLVLKAEHRRMERLVALKVLSPKVVRNPDSLRRFQREVKAAARLTHPNIVTAYDADEAGGTHFLVMEYVEGSDLSALVKQQGPLPLDQALDCILQAAAGLRYAHEHGVVHRDIKPANLLLDRRGSVKILDMGLARLDTAGEHQDELTGTGQIMGTVEYMAPEQAADTRHADGRADIYSLGVTLWYLLTGRPMYTGQTPVEKLIAHQTQPVPSLCDVCSEVSPALEATFRRMVAKTPEERHQTMVELIADLEAFRGGTTAAEVRPPAVEDAKLDAFLRGIGSVAAGQRPRTHPGSRPSPQPQRARAEAMAGPGPQTAESLQATVDWSGQQADTNSRADQALPGGRVVPPPVQNHPQPSMLPWWQDWRKLAACGAAAVVLLVAAALMLRPARPAPDVPPGPAKELVDQAAPQTVTPESPPPDGAHLVLRWPPSERAETRLEIDGRVYDPAELADPDVPDRVSVPLEPGERRLRIARRGYEPFEQTVRLGTGEEVALTPQWRKVAVLASAGEPLGTEASDDEPTRSAQPVPKLPDRLPREQWVDLIQWIDPKRDTVAGTWHRTAEGLTVLPSDCARLAFPVAIEGSYDFLVELSRPQHAGHLFFVLTAGGARCVLALGGQSGLAVIDHQQVENNPTSRSGSGWLDNERNSVLIGIRVRGDAVECRVSVNGQPFTQWAGRQSSLDVPSWWSIPVEDRLGVGATDHGLTYYAARVRLVSDETPWPDPMPPTIGPDAVQPAAMADTGPEVDAEPPAIEESPSPAVATLTAALAGLERLLAQREPREAKYHEAMQSAEALVAGWDFAAAAAALEQVRFDEPELAERLARRREEVVRFAVLKARIIQRVRAADPPLTKRDLSLRGLGGDVVGADEAGITTRLANGKEEQLAWHELGAQATDKLLALAAGDDKEDWLSAGLLAHALGDGALGRRLLKQAQSRGASLAEHLASVAAAELDGAVQLVRAGQYAPATAALESLRATAAKLDWSPAHRELIAAADAAAVAGLRQQEAEKLYKQAAGHFAGQALFDVRPLVEKLRAEYADTAAVLDAGRKPSFEELEEAVAGLGKMITVRQDGKGDFKSIQAAIDAAPPNSLIEIQDSGPYREAIVINTEGITLRGKKPAWPILTSEGVVPKTSSLVFVSAPDVAVERVVMLHRTPGDEPQAIVVRSGARFRYVLAALEDGHSHSGIRLEGGNVEFDTCLLRTPGGFLGGRAEDHRVLRDTIWILSWHLGIGNFELENSLFVGAIHNMSNCKASRCTFWGPIGVRTDQRSGPSDFSDSILRSLNSEIKGVTLTSCIALELSGERPTSGFSGVQPQFMNPKGLDYRLIPGSPGTGKASDGGDIGVRFTPEMIEMLQMALELRARGIIKF